MVEFAYGTVHGFGIAAIIVAFVIGAVVITSPMSNAISVLKRRMVIAAAGLVCLAAYTGALMLAAKPFASAPGGATGMVIAVALAVAGFVPFRRFVHRITGYRTAAFA